MTHSTKETSPDDGLDQGLTTKETSPDNGLDTKKTSPVDGLSKGLPIKKTSPVDRLDQNLAVCDDSPVMTLEYWFPKKFNFIRITGILIAVTMALLLISGIFLMMYYQPNIDLAFDSVNYTIMTEVAYGWLWRHIHSVAGSIGFLLLYIHMFVTIYEGHYKKGGRETLWMSGTFLLIAYSLESFSGYMLPWGQMSYWAGSVITNLFAGGSLHLDGVVEWVRGDYVMGQAYLNRFFMLHIVIVPIAIVGLLVWHFPAKYTSVKKGGSKLVAFSKNFYSKDIVPISIYLVFFFYLVFYNYGFAMETANFDVVNGLTTPAHIYPEWYFLWSYELLRPFSIDVGLIIFGISQVIFFALPALDRSPNAVAANRRGLFKYWFWILLIDMIVLTLLGKLPPTGIYQATGLVASIVFCALWAALPIITKFEKKV